MVMWHKHLRQQVQLVETPRVCLAGWKRAIGQCGQIGGSRGNQISVRAERVQTTRAWWVLLKILTLLRVTRKAFGSV